MLPQQRTWTEEQAEEAYVHAGGVVLSPADVRRGDGVVMAFVG